jgi:competence protein ComGC
METKKCDVGMEELGGSGFALMELLLLTGMVLVLAALVLPQMARRAHTPRGAYCTNNLKQIGLSFKQWALDNNDRYPMEVSVTNGGTMEFVKSGTAWVHFMVMSNELNTPKVLVCPMDERKGFVPATTFGGTTGYGGQTGVPYASDNNVSYFVGVDAVVTGTSLIARV